MDPMNVPKHLLDMECVYKTKSKVEANVWDFALGVCCCERDARCAVCEFHLLVSTNDTSVIWTNGIPTCPLNKVDTPLGTGREPWTMSSLLAVPVARRGVGSVDEFA